MGFPTRILTGLVLCGLSYASTIAMESYNDYGSTYFAPSDKVVTPHIRWARPLADGPLRVLFITNHKSTREVIELAQRLDLDYTVFTTELKRVFAHENLPVDHTSPEDYESRLRAVLRPEQRYDAIVVANLRWDILPSWSRDEIVSRVKSGTGLVTLVEKSDDEQLGRLYAQPFSGEFAEELSPFPFVALPEYGGSEKAPATAATFLRSIVQPFRFHRGRVLRVTGIQPPVRQLITPKFATDPLEVNLLDYDYHLSLAIRLIRWAAACSTPVRVRAPENLWHLTGDRSLGRAKSPSATFVLESDITAEVDVELVVRHRDGDVLLTRSRSVTVDSGEKAVSFALTPLPAGLHFADLWVRSPSSQTIIDFGTLAVEVSAETHLRNLSLTRDSFRIDDRIEGAVMVVQPRGHERLVVDIVDAYGRWTDTTSFSVATNEAGETHVHFHITARSPCSIWQRVRVRLIDGNQVLGRLSKAFTFTDFYAPNDVRYTLFATNDQRAYVDLLYWREVSRAGFDSLWVNPDTRGVAPLAARAHLYRLVQDYGPSSAVRAVATPDGPVRYRCLTDPEVVADIQKGARRLAQYVSKYSNRDFSLASEGGYVRGIGDEANACFSPTCGASFRIWLQKDYSSLTALNKRWQTQFSDWDEVTPISQSAVENEPHRRARWIDHRRHIDSVWARYFEINTAAFREVIPNARVGWQCSGSIGNGITSYRALDYAQMNRAMSLACNYAGPFAPDAARDFLPAGSMVGTDCYGGYEFGRHPDLVRWTPWRSLFRGANTFLVFRGLGHPAIAGPNTGNEMSCVAADLSWYPYMDAGHTEVREIKRGIGKLIMESERDNDGIAILYSAASNHVGTLTPGLPTLADTLNAFPDIFEDSGYQYRTIAPDEVNTAFLQRHQFRAVYLPYVQAMSTREANELKRFVESGGLVIADLRPAVSDEHGKPHARSPLDELFGVEQSMVEAKPIHGVARVKLPVGEFRGRLGLRFSDASLRVTTGRAHATVTVPPLLQRTPSPQRADAVIVHRYGRGTAVLLNVSISQYGVEAGASRKARGLLCELLRTHGIVPEVGLSPSIPGAHLYRFHQSEARYLGLLRNPPGVNVPGHDHGAHDIARFRPEQFVISLPKPSHVYDVRAGRYLGRREQIERTEGDVSPFLIAALPYRAQRLAVTSPDSNTRAGDVVQFEATLHVDGDSALVRHVFHVEVLDPQGRSVPPYTMNRIGAGTCTFEIPFALSDAVGRWTVVVRDVATGTAGRASVDLMPRK